VRAAPSYRHVISRGHALVHVCATGGHRHSSLDRLGRPSASWPPPRLAVYKRTRAPEPWSKDEQATHNEAVRVVERWNAALVAGRGALWSPTIRAAVTSPPSSLDGLGRLRMPWLDVHCPGCRTSRTINIRTIDRPLSLSKGARVCRQYRFGAQVLMVLSLPKGRVRRLCL